MTSWLPSLFAQMQRTREKNDLIKEQEIQKRKERSAETMWAEMNAKHESFLELCDCPGCGGISWLEVATEFCRVDDGLQARLDKSMAREYSGRMDRDRLKRQEVILELIKSGKLIVDIGTGDVFSKRIRGKEGEKVLLKGCVHPSGYRFYRLHYRGEKYFLRGHQIVLWASGKDYPDALQIDHIDRNKLNNSIKNLRLVTAKENVGNSDRMYGEDDPVAKLTEKQVREIVTYYATGDYSTRDLAEMYGIGKSQIHNIVSGKSWVRTDVELDGFKLTKAQHRTQRLKALGNGIVPQVAVEILKAIKRI